VKECEAKTGHLGVARSDREFAGDDGMLLAVGICGGAGDCGSKRIFSDVAAVASGFIDRVAGCRFLAATAREAVRGEAELFERGVALVRGGAGHWDDFVSAGDRWIYRGSFCGDGQVNRKSLAIGFFATLALTAAAYLWIGSAVPPGQEALATLTESNFAEFQNSFDKSVDGPRLVLLLSPT
jgi:hypothetical protein